VSADGYRPELVLAAWTFCVVGCSACLLLWGVGLGSYLEDFCVTRGLVAEVGPSSGPTLAGPTTWACESVPGRVLYAHDWRPLAWTAGSGTVALCLVAAAALFSRRVGRRWSQ
jgi:hypothetical protein